MRILQPCPVRCIARSNKPMVPPQTVHHPLPAVIAPCSSVIRHSIHRQAAKPRQWCSTHATSAAASFPADDWRTYASAMHINPSAHQSGALCEPSGLTALAARIRALAFFATSVLISLPLFVVMVAIYPLVLLVDRHRYGRRHLLVVHARTGQRQRHGTGTPVLHPIHLHCTHLPTQQAASRARCQLCVGQAQHALFQPSRGAASLHGRVPPSPAHDTPAPHVHCR